MMNIEKIYEDEDLLVVNKPAGVVVNETKTLLNQEIIQSWFWQNLSEKQKNVAVESELVPDDFDETYGDPQAIFAERKGMVHRLDKETSGALVLAKNPSVLVNLLDQFKKRQTGKKYLCLVHGRFGVTEDLIAFPIIRSTQDRMKFRVDVEGREAVTAYKVVEYYPALDMEVLKANGVSDESLKLIKKNSNSYQGFSLVECWPKTGRTHQIRVHLNHVKHPLVGDKLYVGKKRRKLDEIWCGRHFLHASELSFTHPRTKEKMQLTASLPAELQQVLNFFKK